MDNENKIESNEIKNEINSNSNTNSNQNQNIEINDENDENEENDLESVMLNPPEILKKEHIHELQGRELAGNLIKAMLMKEEDIDRDTEPRKPYYWEEFPDEIPTSRMIGDNLRYFGSNILSYAESVGNVLVHFLGMDNKQFQDIVDEHEREVENKRIKKLKEEKRREEKSKKIRNLEEGEIDLINNESSDSDSSDSDYE